VAPRDRLHILVLRDPAAEAYTSHGTGRASAPPPPLVREVHGRQLATQAESALQQAEQQRASTAQALGVQPTTEGILLTFESWPNVAMDLWSFDAGRGEHPPELIAVRETGPDDNRTQLATVHVPRGSLGYFLKKFEQYATEDTRWGKPKNASMVERIARLRLATIEALWTDSSDFPQEDQVIWWEIWLRANDGGELERLRSFANLTGADIGERHLIFDNRIIVLVRATARQLASALDLIDDFAELRSAHMNSAFFAQLSPAEQADWVDDLLGRTVLPDDTAPAACILDTGVNRGHPLLDRSLAESDMHTCSPAWNVDDQDGHGTGMAGLTLYGDLRDALEGDHRVRLTHHIESVKILSTDNNTDPSLYGALTAEAVARAEVGAPNRRRAFSMAVTATPDRAAGTPTSWSSAVDALASGRDFDTLNGALKYIDDASVESHRLFVLSAGNVRSIDPSEDYLDRCDVSPVEDPAQAWNALTVGAYTELSDVEASGSDFDGWTPMATPSELSPFSRTGVTFRRDWPNKPEVVLEGGNVGVSPDASSVDWPDSLQVLTTGHRPAQRLLSTTNATSAATASAAHIAATISAEYPTFWPETIRGLIVHSARWTPLMKERFDAVKTNKGQLGALLHRYGYGVPTLERCLRSATNALTLVVQNTIHPFEAGVLREMHLHELPWPNAALADLGETPVRLRATLSYFIEPSPTRLGYMRRYAYSSHQLRFDLQRPTETNELFRKRINKRALDEEETRPTGGGDDDGWILGSTTRNRGSIHSDIWEGTATDLAARGRVSIYPITGWWKELRNRDRSELGARYALLLSIETEAEEVDLWTPVAQAVGLPIIIET
jgi:hypothetical protein